MEVDNDDEKMDQLPGNAAIISENVLREIVKKYKAVIDDISDDHFQPFNDLMRNEAHKTMTDSGGTYFRKKLYESLSSKFQAMWGDMHMDLCVAQLENSKANPLLNNTYWRPSTLTAEEQVRPHLMKILVRKRRILMDQIKSQEKEIDELVSQVESARKIFNAQKDKRSRLLSQIEADCVKIEETHAKIDSITIPN